MFLMVAALLALTAFMFVVAGVPAVAALFAIATVLWVVRVKEHGRTTHAHGVHGPAGATCKGTLSNTNVVCINIKRQI